MTTIRLLPFATADGPTNMAADEAMLETAAEGAPSLRFYTWSEPTLTLGYFQPAADRLRIPSIAALPWVRRATGGAAIVHHHELTYALALPAASVWQPPGESWICRFHHLLSDLLAEHGVAGKLVVCGEERKLGDVLCFLHQTPGDLLVNGSKVAGSAQRKRKGALLQHGSILLQRSEHAPMLEGIHDLAQSQRWAPGVLAEQLAVRVANTTGWAIEPGEWTPAERGRIPVIRGEKYAARDWNDKR